MVKARIRNTLTLLSLAFLVGVVVSISRIPLATLNLLLVLTVVPLVWLIWAFCHWSAYQHASRWARDIAKVHGAAVRDEEVMSR